MAGCASMPSSRQPSSSPEGESSEDNVLSVLVGPNASFKSETNLNNPRVTVTVCVPGKSDCIDIPDVRLDTGSIGLRVLKTAIPFALPSVAREKESEVAECEIFSKHSAWGTIRSADVILGHERAPSVPIQVLDPTFHSNLKTCEGAYQGPLDLQGNGILGVAPEALDCGHDCAKFGDYELYYNCSQDKCIRIAPDTSITVTNPVTRMPKDNNGVIVQFPSLPPEGLKQITGKLILGIGTKDNNRIEPGVRTLRTDKESFFSIRWKGKVRKVMVDTGSSAWYLPGSAEFPACREYAWMACPRSPYTFKTTLIGTDHTQIPFSFVIAAPARFDQFAMNFGIPGFPAEEDFVFGLPFFYGRRVYLINDGAYSPLGKGPLVGF